MAATVITRRWTGPSGTPTLTDITSQNSRHRTDDVYSGAGAANALPVPPTGETRYSFWQHIRMYVSGGSFTTVNNAIFWTDGVSGHPANVVTVGQAASAYHQASGTPGVSGDELTQGNHPNLLAPAESIFNFTASDPLILGGSVSSPGPADLGDFVVMQMQITGPVVTGAVPTETAWESWDEV